MVLFHELPGLKGTSKPILFAVADDDVSDLTSLCSNTSPVVQIEEVKPALSPLIIPTVPQNYHRGIPLPPRDKGWAAYRVLIAATVVSSFPCGVYLCFGVFRAYYDRHPELHSSNSAWIGVLSSGVPFFAAPLIIYICTHVTWPLVHFVWTGWLLGVIAFIGAAYSPSISALIATQGLLFGLSILVADNPLLIIINTWFLSRRGFAYGVIFGMCDACGVAWSFLAEVLLQRLGLRKTFLVFAAIMFSIPGPCVLMLRERGATTILRRSSVSSTSNQTPHRGSVRAPCDDTILSATGGNFDLMRRSTPPTRLRFYKRPIFYILALANFSQSLAFYLPFIYLPSFAESLSLSSTNGALTLALINLAQIVGELGFGKVSDYLNVHLLAILASTLGSLAVFLLWGFARSAGVLYAFALLFGFSGAGYMALWARMGTLFGERDAPMVFGVMCSGRGLGSIVSGPVSQALLGTSIAVVVGGGGSGGWATVYDGKWTGLIIFAGVAMALTTVLSIVGFLVDFPRNQHVGSDGDGGHNDWERTKASWIRRVSATGIVSEKPAREIRT